MCVIVTLVAVKEIWLIIFLSMDLKIKICTQILNIKLAWKILSIYLKQKKCWYVRKHVWF